MFKVRYYKKLIFERNIEMAKQCAICGKTKLKAAKISFSHKQHVHRQEVNLQSVKVNQNGTVKRIDVCTSCIRAGKVQRAV